MPGCHVQLNSVAPLGAVNVTVFTSPWCMAPVLTCRPSMVKLWLLSPALWTSTVTGELAELRRPPRLRRLVPSVDARVVLSVHVITFCTGTSFLALRAARCSCRRGWLPVVVAGVAGLPDPPVDHPQRRRQPPKDRLDLLGGGLVQQPGKQLGAAGADEAALVVAERLPLGLGEGLVDQRQG